VIKEESQAGMKTLTEYDLQDAVQKNGRSAGNGAYARKGTTFEGDGGP
jgi:hypothetical protein